MAVSRPRAPDHSLDRLTLPNRERATRPHREPRSTAVSKHELRSALQAIVLGLVIQRPSYGYEIANRCQRLCGSFLYVRQASVYGALERLSAIGLIEALDSRQRRVGRGARRYFRVTAAGGDAYRNWAESEIRQETERAQLLARIATAGRLGITGLRKVLDGYEQVLIGQAKTLAEVQAADPAHPGLDALCERLVLVERRITLAGAEEWLAVARDEVDDFEARHVRHKA